VSENLPKGLVETMKRGLPLIITHWDADGVISATLLISWLGSPDIDVLIPSFTYSWGRDFLDRAEVLSKDKKYVSVLDLAVPGGTLDLLWTRVRRPVIVIDHHFQTELPRKPGVVYINPARKGDPAGRWPSAAHVLSSIIGYWKDPLLIATSVVVDLGPRARASRVYQDYMVKAGLHPVNDYWIPEECASLIDAASTMGRRDVLEDLPKRLAFDPEPCRLILEDGLLHSLKVQAEEELEEILMSASPTLKSEDVVVYILKGIGRHVSKLARRLAERHKDKIVVVLYKSLSIDRLYAYARSLAPSAPPLVQAAERLRSLGYNAGGKYQAGNNVLAAEAPRGTSEEEMLKDFLNSLRSLGVRI
jgi:hypothetical protein